MQPVLRPPISADDPARSSLPDSERDISGDETLAMGGAQAGHFYVVRYRLRAAAHRIAADCERLLLEMDRPERRAWREAVGECLLASRHLMAVAERLLGHGRVGEYEQRLAAMREELRDPQKQIVQSMTTLLSLVPTGLEEELLFQDARKIRETAVNLGTAQDPVPARPSGSGRTSMPGMSLASLGMTGAVPARPKLLVVDDEEALRRTISRLLTKLGYDVTLAADGRAALEIAEKQPIDLILTDITMPEMDGFELLRRLKANDQTRHIPVIMVSGMNDLQSVVRCIEEGAEDHLTKPYETVLLQARIRSSLERKRLRDEELAYLRRVAQLTAAAEAVERQTYDSQALMALSSENDELGQLARVFDRMVSGIKSREEQLQLRLRQLKREIRQVRTTSSSPGSAGVSDESPFKVGQVLADRYEIQGELGKGGMGMVYLASDRKLGEEIAMKIVRRDLLAQDPTLLERLKSEIRLARRISHRNVVRAHDLGECDGVHFLTMEYVKGVSVSELLQTRGRLTVESTLAIGTQMAEALAVAHDQQIIHRDIKPQNLLIDEEGVLKVMDFGLARLVQRTEGLTQAGLVVGTPRYMAPEQLFGGDADTRTDLFAVGVVLYECLAGRTPFEASSPMAVIAKMLDTQPPPVHEFAPEVPGALASLLAKLLQREPKDRLASARELAEKLSQLQAT